MTKRESIAMEYIFFRFPTHHALVLLPLLTGFIAVFFTGVLLDPSESSTLEVIQEDQIEKINSFLQISKITLIVLLSFFVTFKWAMMKKDGSYGFWLTQLVSRKKYFIKSNIEFVIHSYLGLLIGLVLLFYLNGIQISYSQIIYLFFLSLSSVFQLIVLGVFMGEVIRDPELSTVVYIMVTGIAVFGIANRASIINQIFAPEQHYYGESSVISLLLSWISVVILYSITYYLHQRSSIEI